MRESIVAKRYARALVQTLENEDEYKTIKSELNTFLKLLDRNENLKSGMETLLLSRKQKMEVLESIKKELGFREKTFNFLLAILDENRMIFFDTIVPYVEQFWFDRQGIEKLKVFSAIRLNPEQEERLAKQLEKSLKKKIVIENEKDPDLIAGIKIQRGLVFYDFSIQGNLKKLKDSITDVSVAETFVRLGEKDAD